MKGDRDDCRTYKKPDIPMGVRQQLSIMRNHNRDMKSVMRQLLDYIDSHIPEERSQLGFIKRARDLSKGA